MLAGAESHAVEWTTSLRDDKIGEAICAFANDMAKTGQPGYLLIGVKNDGTIDRSMQIDDNLLKNLASWRDDGRILPIPAIAVEKRSLKEGDIAVIEVQPSDMPPVRYKGRVHIRVGPRRAVASEQEERILTERRRSKARSFDMRPSPLADRSQLALASFKLDYLTAAVAPEIIEENHRELFDQMSSLGFWDADSNCATNAGALLFGEDPLRFMPGAYVQYGRFDGLDMNSDLIDERRFAGNLITVLRLLDEFVKVLFPVRPEPVTALRENARSAYPVWAVREILMNAVMHRDYESNAPIYFNQFSDRIEIQNPGGLFGSVTPYNFPKENDYRNPKIAEAMKTLGFVNRFRLGIVRTQNLLKQNGNPEAQFTIDQPAFFSVNIKAAGL